LIGVPVVAPVAATVVVFDGVMVVAQPEGKEGDAEVVVGVLDAAAEGAGFRACTGAVDVVFGDVSESVPAYKVSTAFYTPVLRFLCKTDELESSFEANCQRPPLTFCIRDDGFVGSVPVNARPELLDIGISNHDVCVGAALGISLGEAHPAVG
jgi:hypothetical protein